MLCSVADSRGKYPLIGVADFADMDSARCVVLSLMHHVWI